MAVQFDTPLQQLMLLNRSRIPLLTVGVSGLVVSTGACVPSAEIEETPTPAHQQNPAPPFDVREVVSRVHLSFRPVDDAWVAISPGYTVRADGGGVSISPRVRPSQTNRRDPV